MTELPQILLQFLQEEEEYRREIQLEKTITENQGTLCLYFPDTAIGQKRTEIGPGGTVLSDRAGRAVVVHQAA